MMNLPRDRMDRERRIKDTAQVPEFGRGLESLNAVFAGKTLFPTGTGRAKT